MKASQLAGRAAIFIALAVVGGCSETGKISPVERAVPDAVTVVGKATTFEVAPGEPIDEQIGDVRIVGNGEAVRSGGVITVQPVDIDEPPTNIGGLDLTASKGGVLVDLGKVKLGGPLDLQFDNRELDAGEAAIGLHLADDGTWTLIPDTTHAGSTTTVSTNNFSIISDAVSGALRPLGNLLARAFTGRSSPPDCGAAPKWASAKPPSTGSDHTCVRTVADPGAELEIKSNRGIYHWIKIPKTPPRKYLWVEDEPDAVRRAISRAVFGGDETAVLVGPGSRMTAGYAQPATTVTVQFGVYDDYWSLAATLVNELVSLAYEDRSSAVVLLIVARCAGVVDAVPPIAKPHLSADIVECLVDIVASLKDPKKAVNLAVEVLGKDASAKELAPLSEILQRVGSKAKALAKVLTLGTWIAKEVTALLDVATQNWGPDKSSAAVLKLTARSKPVEEALDWDGAKFDAGEIVKVESDAASTILVFDRWSYDYGEYGTPTSGSGLTEEPIVAFNTDSPWTNDSATTRRLRLAPSAKFLVMNAEPLATICDGDEIPPPPTWEKRPQSTIESFLGSEEASSAQTTLTYGADGLVTQVRVSFSC